MVKFIRYVCCLSLCLLHLSLLAQEPSSGENPLIVKSGEAQYDGKEIVLVGEVVVQHSLGQISARRFSITSDSDGDKKNKFSLLKMSQDVQIELQGGGTLRCSEAEVDYAKCTGIFNSSIDYPEVVFTNEGEKNASSEEERPLLEVKSEQMTINLIRESSSATSSAQTAVNEIQCIDHVSVHYHENYHMVADRAVYQRLPSQDLSVQGGVLTLTVEGKHPTCLMSTLNGDRVEAQVIKLDSIGRCLSMEHTKGFLSMQREKQAAHHVEFSSDELLWNDRDQVLYLYGKVSVTQNGTIQVNTDQKLSIARTVIDGKSTLRFIQVPQRTEMTYLDPLKNVKHQITCPGSLMMNHEEREIFLDGLPEGGTEGDGSKQVYLDDELGEMYADHVHISYEWENGAFVPNKITLEGHVRLLNRFDGHMQESASILHYALADRVDYFPGKPEMVLSGKANSRVLFFDKVNQVQMSALSLTIRQDGNTKKELIQGAGDVRFTFMDQELQQIKKRFRLEEKI